MKGRNRPARYDLSKGMWEHSSNARALLWLSRGYLTHPYQPIRTAVEIIAVVNIVVNLIMNNHS